MHISILLWGLTGVLGRGINLSEGLLVWYRLIIVSVSLFVYVKFAGKNLKVGAENFRKLFWVGTLLMVHWIFFYGAIKYSNISYTLSAFSSTTLFTALFEPLVTKKKFNWRELLYSFLAMAGIALVFYSDENSFSTGIILALLAAFIGAFFNILNKDIVRKVPSSVVSFYEISSGFIVLTVLLPFYIGYFHPVKLLPDTTDWLLLLVLGIVCTHITLVLSLNALKHLSAFTLNLAINLEPIYAITLAFVIYQENTQLNKYFFIGAGIIMLSVLLHSWFEREQTKTPLKNSEEFGAVNIVD